jgi:hypothetical protein
MLSVHSKYTVWEAKGAFEEPSDPEAATNLFFIQAGSSPPRAAEFIYFRIVNGYSKFCYGG